jgi:hypothetical protein
MIAKSLADWKNDNPSSLQGGIMKRRFILFLWAFIGLWTIQPAHLRAEQQSLHVLLDVTNAPDAGEYALKTNTLLLEWYPRINALLYDPNHPLPYAEIRAVFEPVLAVKQAPALARGNEIHVNSEYIKHMPDDFRAMVIHELTHVVQHYQFMRPDMGWVVEGIADYVRHKYYEKDIEQTLHLDSNGFLVGYGPSAPYFNGLQQSGVNLTDQGYLRSYTVASTFLFWLETHKDLQIVQHLNGEISQGRYSPDLFYRFCGKSLDDLWAEFVKQSKVH